MRRRIFGVIGIVWGGALLALHLLRGMRSGGIGAYSAGRGPAFAFAGLVFAVGLYLFFSPKTPDA